VTIDRKRAPRRRRRGRWILGTLFALLAVGAGAWGIWTYLVPHSVRVPPVVGSRLATARAELESADLTVRIAAGRYTPGAAEGSIVAVRPAAGTELRTGSVVTLVPSLGPPPVKVPTLVGLTVPQARRALAKAGLELGQHPSRFDTSRPAGRVVAQGVASGGERPQGSAIDVVVSKGPPPVPVPKVVGKTEDQARTALGDFAVIVATDYSDSVTRGHVISQDPAAKSELQPGAQVHLVISLGPQQFPVPSFQGLSRDDAVSRIRSLGLVPSVYPVPGSSGTTVVSQLPNAGTIVKAGSTITIYIA
jgi:eukaryotic-like serine/threonine-protein kinase